MSSKIFSSGRGLNASAKPQMRNVKIFIGLSLMLFGTRLLATTTLDFWHSYVHAQTSDRHYAFNLVHYKRGLFWGSCGPSTKSQQWGFKFDLAGDGPVYTSGQLQVSDDNGAAMNVVSGQVVTDLKRSVTKIDIQVESAGRTNKFVGNGEYRIKNLR